MTHYLPIENGTLIFFTDGETNENYRHFVHTAFKHADEYEEKALRKQELLDEGVVHR